MHHTRITNPSRTVTVDLDRLDQTEALYLIDLISEALDDPDPITSALSEVAWDIVDCRTGRFEAADELYPQCDGIWTPDERARLVATRDAYLRRFGILGGAE
jgi:hypothetical protein